MLRAGDCAVGETIGTCTALTVCAAVSYAREQPAPMIADTPRPLKESRVRPIAEVTPACGSHLESA